MCRDGFAQSNPERRIRHERNYPCTSSLRRRRACADGFRKDDLVPLNGLVAGTKYEGLPLEEIVAASRDAGDTAIFNNAAQIWNHDFYWRSLAPAGKGGEPSAELLAAINASFGSLDACKTALADAAVKRFGSGWAWLLKKDGKLVVESTSNADTPCGKPGVKPLLVIDVWEHAYYLDWQNQRAAYVKAVVDGHLNWSAASAVV